MFFFVSEHLSLIPVHTLWRLKPLSYGLVPVLYFFTQISPMSFYWELPVSVSNALSGDFWENKGTVIGITHHAGLL